MAILLKYLPLNSCAKYIDSGPFFLTVSLHRKKKLERQINIYLEKIQKVQIPLSLRTDEVCHMTSITIFFLSDSPPHVIMTSLMKIVCLLIVDDRVCDASHLLCITFQCGSNIYIILDGLDSGNIVSISGNIFLYPPKKSHPILLLSFI